MRLIILQELIQKRCPSWRLKGSVLIVLAITLGIGLFLYLNHQFPLNLTRYHLNSSLLYDKEDQILSVALSKDGYWRIPADLNNIDPIFIQMLIHFEDKRFYHHPGIDPFAVLRAIFQWGTSRKVISGASTLTLQTVRLLEARPRTLKNKCIECFRALQLEYQYPKREILRMYLSLAPYGGNIEGITAASLHYFGKSPKQLRVSEAAWLIALPQRPNILRWDPDFIISKKIRDKVLNRFKHQSLIAQKKLEEAFEEPVPQKKFAFPRISNHLLNPSLYSKASFGKTHLDKELQLHIESLLKLELPFLEKTQTIAVLVVENKNQSIRAYVANADFFSEDRKGQVNMIEAIRSPGSTLKPFIYGIGFDEGIIQPETILEDIPTQYGDYSPTNFKDKFHGEVTVKEALQQSLNIPVITILDKIHPHRFAAHLSNIGIQLHFSDKQVQASLPIALGGVGLNLRELVSLYVMLANEGSFYPLQLWKNNASLNQPSTEHEHQFLSPKAAWQINSILEETLPPEGMLSGNVSQGPLIAYKTGTSYGFRDAWAIGYTKDYTVGVWVGKPEGSPSFNQTGRQNAAPLVFKIMRLLPMPKETLTQKKPSNDFKSPSAAELPEALRRLEYQKNKINNALILQFPKEGMVIHVSNASSNTSVESKPFQKIYLQIRGGKPPFYLFINGQPEKTGMQSKALVWQPQTLGFQELLLIDSEGNSSSATVELR